MKTALIVDDHPITHIGCGHVLRDVGFETVLSAQTMGEAYRTAERDRPDLIVLDLGMPGVGGLAMIRPLLSRLPDCRILVFTMNEEPTFASRALEAGAMGFLSKNSTPEQFREAVATLARGEVFLSHDLAVRLAVMNSGRASDPIARLSQREQQVLRLLGEGMDLQRIADDINVSYKTVANVSSALKKKLGADGLSDLIRISIRTFSA